MTDYDYFPPIRFRFSGDVDQAKGRIPQARTLMAQLIRRMEGFGRDAGQWQGQMSDGTQFRVAKMGDVHVADIFGVTPSVKPPVNARGVAYDVRVITPGIQMAANPEAVIPATVIPEIPETPHTYPRDILMRPHGERFESGNNYLWVGARLIFPDYSEDLYPTSTRPLGSSIETAKWRDTPGQTGTWVKYIGFNVPGVVSYANAGYYELPIGLDSSVEFEPFVTDIPTVNLVLFAPDAAEQVAGSVFQTLNIKLYDGYTNQYLSIATAPSYNEQDKVVWWNTAATAYHERGWVVDRVDDLSGDYYFSNNVWETRGVYTSDLVYKKDNPIPSQAYLCLDQQDPSKTRQDYISPYVPDLGLPVADGQNQIANGEAVEVQSSTSGDPGGAFGTAVRTVTHTGVRVITDADSSVEVDEPSITQATDTDIKDGYYELRMSAGFLQSVGNINVDGWRDVSCEVYIQVGRTLKNYTVSLNATNSYADTSNFINFGSEYNGSGTIGGLFNVKGWIEEGNPTPMDDTWYQGCWLIDIKNQTVIHETNPANLTRDWFTTE